MTRTALMKCILFDVDGVLIDGYHYRPELRKCWHKTLQADFGIDPDYFSSSFFVDPFTSKVLPGIMDLKDALSQWLPSVGYTQNAEIFIHYWLEKDSTLNSALIEKIKILKNSGKVRLFIATNQAHIRAQYLMKTLGLDHYFEDIFYSAKMKSMKPSEDYFNFISRTLNLAENDKPIIFDDTPDVIKFAKSIGWEGYEFTDAESIHECSFVNNILQSDHIAMLDSTDSH